MDNRVECIRRSNWKHGFGHVRLDDGGRECPTNLRHRDRFEALLLRPMIIPWFSSLPEGGTPCGFYPTGAPSSAEMTATANPAPVHLTHHRTYNPNREEASVSPGSCS